MLAKKLINLWYQKKLHPILWVLVPFSFLFLGLISLRRFAYRSGFLSEQQFSVPVIVVGNITLGGTGKTPLTIHIAKLLNQHGFKAGIVTRGYGGKAATQTFVNANSEPALVGDEPVLLAKRLFCPIVVDSKRCRAIELLQKTHPVDVIISDDGLQHYAMGRQIEILVVDGKRRFGNGWCLPAGPLREPLSRLKKINFIVVNTPETYEHDGEFDMMLRPRTLIQGDNLSEQRTLTSFQGETVHAVAGIGNPEQFFDMLKNYGLKVIPHPFPDHHRFLESELLFDGKNPVILTEKDAVKCVGFLKSYHWVLSVDAILNPLFDAQLLSQLKELKRG